MYMSVWIKPVCVKVIGHHLGAAAFLSSEAGSLLFSQCCTLQASDILHGLLSNSPVSSSNLCTNGGVTDACHRIQLFVMGFRNQTQILRILLQVLIPARTFYPLLFSGFLNVPHFPVF